MINKVKRSEKYFSIICSIVIFLCMFGPWMDYEEKTYTLIQFYTAIFQAGGIMKFAAGELMVFPAFIYLMLALLSCVLYVVNILMLLTGRESKILRTIASWSQFLYFAGYYGFGGYQPLLCAFLAPGLTFVEFLGRKFIADWPELSKQNEKVKQEEAEAKEEQKRRLDFKGRYTKSFYNIIYKNFRYYTRYYLLLIISGILSVASLFTVFALQQLLQSVHTPEEMFIGGGLQKVIMNVIPFVVVVSAVLMGLAFSYYMKNKLRGDSVLITLGIRQKTMTTILVIEYLASLVCALFIGLIIGNVIVFALRKFLSSGMGTIFDHSVNLKAYLWVLGIFIVITLISAAVNYEVYLRITWSAGVMNKLKKEKIPKRFLKIIMLVGAFLMGIAAFCFAKREWAEDIRLVYLFGTGLCLTIIVLAAVFIKKSYDRSGFYYNHMLAGTPFFYRFRKSIINILILTVVHFLLLTVFGIQLISSLIAAPVEQLYPYDFVCMASPDDDEFFENLKKEYELDITNYPMVRTTTVQGDTLSMGAVIENANVKVIWPQGQNIGISESDYLELKQKVDPGDVEVLGLEDEQIHIVYQQDSSFKAHPLDWYQDKTNPYIRIGQPLKYYEWTERETLYPPRQVVSQEMGVLTGMFHMGMQENIVVFSDAYFEKIHQETEQHNEAGRQAEEMEREAYAQAQQANITEGPTQLYVIQTTAADYGEIKAELAPFGEKHQIDSSWDDTIKPYYDRHQMIQDVSAERYMKIIMNVSIIIMLLICSLFILYIKFSFEGIEMKGRYRLLRYLGIKDAQERHILTKEMRPFFSVPIILGTISAVVFVVITFKLRMYQKEEIAEFLKYGFILWLGYTLIQWIWYKGLKRMIVRMIK